MRSYSLGFFLPVTLIGCGVFSFSVDPAAPSQGIPKATIVHGVPSPGDSVTVIAGPEYAAGWLHRALFGAHYRTLWTAPVDVPVLDLSRFSGGLTPVKKGGGFQTRSLRLQGGNGRLYAFRSVNKDPAKALPPELQATMAADVVQDQISSSNPASALVVHVLAEALGVLHGSPMLCLLPDDERLGEFRDEFAGILGVLEEYPEDGPGGSPGFAGSTRIVSTLKMYETIQGDYDERVDASRFLVARLLDVLVGDWDRHVDQWRWARFGERGHHIWHPISRDRDQAFARMDGLFPWIGVLAITQVEGFHEGYGSIADLTFSGRFLDRKLLVGLGRADWDSVTAWVISRMTDEVLEAAVRNLPPRYYDEIGAWLVRALKKRRDGLWQASSEFYLNLSDYVDIHLSDRNELVQVTRLEGGMVEVLCYGQTGDREKARGTPLYQRVFSDRETKEIRVYLLGGDDRAIVTGEVGSSILVRIIGGEGDDELVDESRVRGRFLGIFPRVQRLTYFYDDAGRNTLLAGAGTVVDAEKYHAPPAGVTQY